MPSSSASVPRVPDQVFPPPIDPSRKRDERRAFVLLAIILAPVLAVALVGGYAFVIWMTQLILGPPSS